ncbi:SGNH/GDSL hydrolase family protein [Amycolatopsis thermoflava]|uniref:SGNH/GDSL hydrolase family protein n=1 Tax=Amycolatopsis thermoflava TaxID=84480 RepID=UPI00042527B7|nr:GDSL-type esterase/lipase family protein [Amycolatopsis thermoflava]
MSRSDAVRVVCAGDSITRGQVSVDYVELLGRRSHPVPTTFVNAGVNYDVTSTLRRRVGDIVEQRPDVVTVLIGTNDANATLGESNRRLVTMIRRPPAPLTREGFRSDLAAVATELRKRTGARLGLLSLPVIGEDLDSEPLRRSTEFSGVIREVADATGVSYLPLHERQLAYLREHPRTPGTVYRPGLRLSVTASTQHFMLRRSFDDISRRRGLSLTTDTIHQNSTGAGLIADVIGEFVAGVG